MTDPRPRIGCSSWTSDAWWDRVYPKHLKDGDRLAWYAKLWDTVEVDATYYRDPGPFLFRRWASVTPDGFLFALKFPRDLLDPKKRSDQGKIIEFLSNAVLLGPKLGPILLQFPPWVKPGRASGFLEDVLAALDPRLRYAVELRDAGWFSGETFVALQQSLADRRVALAWSYLTYVDVPAAITSDFVYLRFIGDHDTISAETHGEVRARGCATSDPGRQPAQSIQPSPTLVENDAPRVFQGGNQRMQVQSPRWSRRGSLLTGASRRLTYSLHNLGLLLRTRLDSGRRTCVS